MPSGRGLIFLRLRGRVSGSAEARRPRGGGSPGLGRVWLLRRPVGGPESESVGPLDGKAHLQLVFSDTGEEGHHRGLPHRGPGAFLRIEEEENTEGMIFSGFGTMAAPVNMVTVALVTMGLALARFSA